MTIDKVTVPDFGDVQEIVVVEVYVSVGDSVALDESLIALESEKAVMDIPAPIAGVVEEIYVKENDVVKSGAPILSLKIIEDSVEEKAQVPVGDEQQKRDTQDHEGLQESVAESLFTNIDDEIVEEEKEHIYHATPAIRALGREKGVDLGALVGTGPKGRIVKEDVETFLQKTEPNPKSLPAPSAAVFSSSIPESRGEDFSRFGAIENVALPRIKKVSGPHLQRSWQEIPHVTQFDEADMSELELFRKQLREQGGEGARYSPLIFVLKAAVAALKAFPLFNSSLQEGGDSVVLKNYYHIGIAVDTENGLMVPVIRDVDTKGIAELAGELSALSQAAREGKLTIDQLQGASFTISSLGSIGGTGFTPIVNAPQVAILGLSRNYMKPVWDPQQEKFLPQLTLPFSVSYDHRVIDGADGARFCRALAGYIEDLRMILL